MELHDGVDIIIDDRKTHTNLIHDGVDDQHQPVSLIRVCVQFAYRDIIVILEGMNSNGEHELIIAHRRDLLVVLDPDNTLIDGAHNEVLR